MLKKSKTPWSTKAIMEQIYNKHLWGGNHVDFYSGEGSHNPEIIKPYLETVINFLESQEKPLVVCDFGCGDFNIGKQLTKYSKTYFAIDIVERLIERNKNLYKADNLEFLCLDIANDKLPKGDCVILRQVLQHLSNFEIQNITKKLIDYKYIILTEHIPFGNFIPNQDIISGQGNRTKVNSGVDILEAPFNLKIKTFQNVVTHIEKSQKSKIITNLYQMF